MNSRGRAAGRAGFTLAEVLVGVSVLTFGLLSLSAAAAGGFVRNMRAREEARYWADAQEVVDSLLGRGFGNVASGSAVVRGRQITWTAGSAATAPQVLTVLVQRTQYRRGMPLVSDTIVLYLAKDIPGP